jgi:hypothetical protein
MLALTSLAWPAWFFYFFFFFFFYQGVNFGTDGVGIIPNILGVIFHRWWMELDEQFISLRESLTS